MKVQKISNRIVEDKEYYKYILIIPSEAIKKLKWDGAELQYSIDDKKLILERKK